VQPARSVEDDDVSALAPRLVDSRRDRLDRVGAREDRDLQLAAELLELLDGGGAREICGDERG
jgi:hypothetical protein